MSNWLSNWALSATLLSASVAGAIPDVPGYAVSVYGTASLPARIAFDAAGALYVGNGANALSGGPITRIAAGGGVGAPFGPSIFDPDAVLVDTTGAFSGTPGTVLVGGAASTGNAGAITAIRPDQAASVLITSSAMANPGRLAFDQTGRLLITDFGDSQPDKQAVFAVTGTSVVRLFVEEAGAAPDGLAVSASNQIYTSGSDGVIRVHGSNGALLNGSFASGLGPFPLIEFGRFGAGFDTALYALSTTSGALIRYDSTGAATVIGTDFAADSTDLLFGPDGAIYVSQLSAGNVLRIAAVPEPGTAVLLIAGLVGLSVRYRQRGQRGRVARRKN
jgi:hypothetical protein